MRPSILIIEPRHDVASALEDVVNSANYVAVIMPYVERLADVEILPAAIIVRIAFESTSEPTHASIARLGTGRPPVVAIASGDNEVAEAHRLKCDVVLRAPRDVSRLCDVLADLVNAPKLCVSGCV